MKGGKSAPRKPLNKEGGYLITELHVRNIKWTRDMGIMSTVEMQIAERSRKYPGAALTNLHSYITPAYLHGCYEELNKNSSRGVDGKSWDEYKVNAKEAIEKMHSRFKDGSYRAPHIR
jgi:hypothetical protein